MRRRCGPLPWLLLALMQRAWAAVRVSVPSSPIRAPPGSDVRLPCNFSDSSRPLNLSNLAVMWNVGEKMVAQYEDSFKPFRPGAVMFVEQLLKGDATLLLRDVQDRDASVYTCFVIHMPNKGEGRVELKVEAPPRLTLSPTKVRLDEQTTVTCTMSEFYPSHITVEWLRNDVVVKGLESPLPQSKEDGLFNANSVFQLTPNLADVGANFSCRVHHQALDGLLKKDFQLQVQACPIIQDLIVLEERNLRAAKCLVSGFYPKKIKVQWFRNWELQETMQSEPQQMPNGTFTISSSIIQSESDPTASYVCKVFHESLGDSLNQTAHWQTKGEREMFICPTSPTSQSTEKKLNYQQSQPTSPTSSSSSPGCSELSIHSYIWIGLTIVFIVSTLGLGATLIYYKTQGKLKSESGTKGEVKKLEDVKKSSDCSRSEHLNVNDSTQVALL